MKATQQNILAFLRTNLCVTSTPYCTVKRGAMNGQGDEKKNFGGLNCYTGQVRYKKGAAGWGSLTFVIMA